MRTDQSIINRYTVTAGVLSYSVTFPLYAPGDVLVMLSPDGGETERTLKLGDDYSVTINDGQTGGTVTLKNGVASAGNTLALLSNVPYTQELDLSNVATIDVNAMEKQLDRSTQQVQQLKEQVERSVIVPPTSSVKAEELVRDLFNARAEAVTSAGEARAAEAGARQAEQDVKAWPGRAKVLADGSTTPRALQERFADVVNVKDFGAKGDGVTDDTQAVIFADAWGEAGSTIDLLGLTVKTDYWPSRNVFTNGYLLYQGKLTNVDGSELARLEMLAQKKLCELQIYNADNTVIFHNAYNAAQGVAYLEVDGVEKIFMSIRTYGASLPYAYQKCVFAEYTLTAEGTRLELVDYTPALPVGHGQGFGAQVVDGQIYLYCQETGVPNRYKSSDENFGKGFTRIQYKGSATTVDDVTSYRLLPFFKSEDSWDKTAKSNFLTPTISPDGTKLVGMGNGNGFVYVWPLADILNCTTPDVDYTWAESGTGETEPHPGDSYIPASRRIDASSVKPVISFALDSETFYGRQGIACDAKYIYCSYGIGNPMFSASVEVYDWSGHKVKSIVHSGARAFYSEEQLFGLDSSLGVLFTHENEGMFVRGNQLCTLWMAKWRNVTNETAVVSRNGLPYVCRTNNTGTPPEQIVENAWLPTNLPITHGEWSAETAYIGLGDVTDNAKQEVRVITAITASDEEGAVPLAHGLITKPFDGGYSDSTSRVVFGRHWALAYFDPISGKRTQRAYLNDSNFYLYDGKTAEGGALHVFTDLLGKDKGGSNSVNFEVLSEDKERASARITFYSPDNQTFPGEVHFRSNGASRAKLSSQGFAVSMYGSTGAATTFKGYNATGQIFDVNSGGTGIYFVAFNKNLIFARRNAEDTDSVGISVFSNDIRPTKDNKFSFGTSSLRWAEIFAGTGAINTSDAREKTSVADPDEALMRAWGKVNFKSFQFTDAVAKKGEEARIHFGVIAQQVAEAFASEGLDASRYALFCHDKWEDEYEDVDVVDVEAVLDEQGNEVTPAVTHTEKWLVTPAGDRYGIRYSEALALECAYQRWRLDKLEAKLNAAD